MPTTHALRVRTRHLLDRSLDQVEIDAAALEARLARYTAWLADRRSTTTASAPRP